MWEPRRLSTLWAFTVCYRDSFTFTRLITIALNISNNRSHPFSLLGHIWRVMKTTPACTLICEKCRNACIIYQFYSTTQNFQPTFFLQGRSSVMWSTYFLCVCVCVCVPQLLTLCRWSAHQRRTFWSPVVGQYENWRKANSEEEATLAPVIKGPEIVYGNRFWNITQPWFSCLFSWM
jgi:hypothetical protein